MIKVTGFYRWEEGAHFDHEYYHSEHMQLTKNALSPHGLNRLESDRFLSSNDPVTGQIIAATHAYFPNMEIAQAAMAAAAQTLIGNVPRYTNLKPLICFSVTTSYV